MQDPGPVDLLDRLGHRLQETGRDPRGQRVGGPPGEAAPGDQVEDQVEAPILLARLVERDDVGMADPDHGLGLAEPAFAVLGLGAEVPAHDLDRHPTGQLRLPGLVDHPHPAPPQLAPITKPGIAGDGPEPASHSGTSPCAVVGSAASRSRIP